MTIWKTIAVAACFVLFAVVGYAVRDWNDRITATFATKLDVKVYEADKCAQQSREANRDRMICVVYNAHVVPAMRMECGK